MQVLLVFPICPNKSHAGQKSSLSFQISDIGYDAFYVTAGDKVKKGKALVLGRIDIYNDAKEIAGYQYCKADADIVAQTSYPYRYEVPTLVQKRHIPEKRKNAILSGTAINT